MNSIPQEIQHHWVAISQLFSIPNEQAYDLAIERLNDLIDEVGTDEQHPLYGLLDMLGMVIHAYEEKHFHIPECDGISMLKFLMAEHGLTSTDLPEIGESSIVLEILNGNRVLDANQISALSKKIQVSPAVFISDQLTHKPVF